MKVSVDIKVEGFFHWEGEVDTKEEAKAIALTRCTEADFGPLEAIDFDVYLVEEDNE